MRGAEGGWKFENVCVSHSATSRRKEREGDEGTSGEDEETRSGTSSLSFIDEALEKREVTQSINHSPSSSASSFDGPFTFKAIAETRMAEGEEGGVARTRERSEGRGGGRCEREMTREENDKNILFAKEGRRVDERKGRRE